MRDAELGAMRFQAWFTSRAYIVWLAVCIAPAAGGCYPITQLQGPRTVAAGEFQVGTAVGFSAKVGARTAAGIPLDLAVRYGALDKLDLSFRVRPAPSSLTNSVLALGAKSQLVRSDQIELSIAPSIMQAFIDRSGFDDEYITPLVERLGDRRSQRIIQRHNRALRRCVEAQQGSEVAHTGDGLIAA